MNRKSARSLKVGARVMWNGDPKDLGTVRGVGRAAVSIRWDVDTSTGKLSTLHVDDMELVSLAAPIFVHGIGGGVDLRHQGCAPQCCEADAMRTVEGPDDPIWTVTKQRNCGGCDGRLDAPALRMDFDRDEICETHADEAAFEKHRTEDPHCTCTDCLNHHESQEIPS